MCACIYIYIYTYIYIYICNILCYAKLWHIVTYCNMPPSSCSLILLKRFLSSCARNLSLVAFTLSRTSSRSSKWYIYIYTYGHICKHVCMYVCMYMYMCIYIYICFYLSIYLSSKCIFLLSLSCRASRFSAQCAAMMSSFCSLRETWTFSLFNLMLSNILFAFLMFLVHLCFVMFLI